MKVLESRNSRKKAPETILDNETLVNCGLGDRSRGMPIGKFLSRIKGAFLFFAIGSAADVFSTWLCWATLKSRQGHEANFIVMAFVRWLGVPAGLVGCKVAAAFVVLGSSATLGRVFPKQITDYRLAEVLLVAMGCIYLAAGFWNFCGLALSRP